MENQFRRKMAAFLAAVMFTTSIPFSALAEDTAAEQTEMTGEVSVQTVTEVPPAPATEAPSEPATEAPSEPATEAATELATEPEVQPAGASKGPLMKSAGRSAANSNGITLRMVSSKALIGTLVDFAVSAPGADTYTVEWYDAERTFISTTKKTLTDGVGTFQSAVSEPCTEIIVVSAEIDGVTYTDEMTVVYTSLGKTPGIPQIICEEMPVAHQSYEVTWTAVDGADYYYLYWESPSGQYWWRNYLEETSYTIPADQIPAEGEYRLQVAALKAGYDLGEKAEKKFTVTGSAVDQRVTITASNTQMMVGENVRILVSAPGAEAVRLYHVTANGSWYEQENADRYEMNYGFSQDRTLYAMALYDGVWVASERITITVRSNGKLDAPEFTMPSEIPAGQDVTVSWTAVEGAESYSVWLYREENGSEGEFLDGRFGYTGTEVTFNRVLEPGSYKVKLHSEAAGYESGQTEMVFSVTGELAAPPVLALDAERYVRGSKITYTITAEGAEKIRLYYYGSEGEGTYSFDATGTTTTYEHVFAEEAGNFHAMCSVRINGIWTAYCAPVSFEIYYQGKLDAPVLSLKSSYAAGEEITVSWDPVEDAEQYSIRLTDGDGNYINSWWTDADKTSVELKALLEAGDYRVEVSSLAEGYESGKTVAAFTVTGALAAAPMLMLDAQSYVPGDKITYTVTAEGAQKIRVKISGTSVEGYSYSDDFEFAADGTTTVYQKQFYGAGSFQARCCAQVDGAWSAWSEPVSFEAHYLGELRAPVLSMQNSYAAGEEITVSWSTVENAEEYSVELQDSDGNDIDRWWTDDGTSVVMDIALEAGTYRVQVYAWAEGWESSETAEHTFTVTGALAEGPSFTVDKTTVVTGNQVTFTVSMEGAGKFRMEYDKNTTEYAAENGTATITRTLYGADKVVEVRFSAFIDGVWTAYGPAQQITIQDRPTLDSTFPVLPETIRAGEDVAMTWSAVENAEYYYVYVYAADGTSVWSDYVNAATEECSAVIPAGKMKQGRYTVSVMAYASGYNQSKKETVEMEVGEPLPENAFYCTYSSDGTTAYLYDWLGDPNAAEVVIPATIRGATIVGIYGGSFLKNNGTLKKVTIPASVTYITDYAFAGSVDLTICGYSGSDAEEYALLKGYSFEPLDSGETSVVAAWEETILINIQTTVTINAPGATDVRMYMDGSWEDYDGKLLMQDGAKVYWTPAETGEHFVRFEVKIGDEWVTSKNYVLTIVEKGQMPQVKNLKASAETIEPGTAVTITWENPEGLTAPLYSAACQKPGASISESDWYSVTEGETSYTFQDSWFDQEGTYTLAVRTEPLPGYEPTVTTCTVEVKSTRTWDIILSTGELVAYHGSDKEIVIPAEVEGVSVRTIGNSIFKGSDITSVVIPEGVRTISFDAFRDCTALTSVSLPTTLWYIYEYAFAGCAALSEVRLPENLSSLGRYAFSGCAALTSITIPSGIRQLNVGVFDQCAALARVILPDGLTSISWDAFGSCGSLKSIIIPQSVATIDQNAFRNNEDMIICGYLGSAAETFAEEQGYDFVALDSIQTGEIFFVLEKDTVYNGGLMKITVTAPDAEKLRLHLDDSVSECSIYNGQAEISRYIHGLGEHTVTVSQCVDGKWMAPCEAVTFTVVELEAPAVEPIDSVCAGTPLTIRWKPVEGAQRYSLYLSLGDDTVTNHHDITGLDAEGFVCWQLTAEELAHEGIYSLQITARAADEGSAYSSCTFEVLPAEEFLYEVNADGTATLIGHTGNVQNVTVPALLDGYTVVEIAGQAFLNSQAVSITLPATVKLVNSGAFHGCETLETVRISDATATIRAYAFEDCSRLIAIYTGAGIFAEPGAFGGCRTDTVVYGWSGGVVEEEAESSCRFSSLGALAAGPVVAAEDIWQDEELTYTITCEGASRLYLQVVYPDGDVETLTMDGDTTTGKADGHNFNAMTEDGLVRIRTVALVNGVWTAYGEKEVTVSVLGVLEPPVFEEIGRLERHRDHVIRWEPVENAQIYDARIYKLLHAYDLAETFDATTHEIRVRAGSLTADDYTIWVRAEAEGYRDAIATAEFEVYEMKLDTPVISVEERIPRHKGAVIQWEPVPDAQTYSVLVQAEGEDGPVTLYRADDLEATSLELSPRKLRVGGCTVTVTAHAQYCVSSDAGTAEFEIYEEQLAAPEVTAPQTVVGGVDFDVTWKPVENVQKYHLEILDGSQNRVYSHIVYSQSLSVTIRLDKYLTEGDLAVRVTASAEYFKDGITENTVAYKPLYSYEIVGSSAVITGYNGPDTVLSVPDEINGYAVTAIGDGAFENMDKLVEVYLPESIASIGARSFKNCTALQYVEGDGVTEIGEEAFYNCTSLRKFSFGKKHEYQVTVMHNAFYNTPVVEEPEDLGGLMDITVTQKQDGSGNEGGNGGEDGEGSGDGSEELPSYAGNLYIGSVTYEEGITRIPAETHYGNVMLGTVYLPQSLQSIGSEAFADCPSLTYVRVYDEIESIAEDAFSGSDKLMLHIYTSDMEKVSYVEAYAQAHGIPYNKHYAVIRDERLHGLTYPEGTSHIGTKECIRQPWLEKVWLPQSLESIGSRAFAECESLMEICLYDSISSIADNAFEGSENVRFIVYTDDLDKDSYVLQYAAAHGIPVTKYLKVTKPADAVDSEDPKPSTVRIDVPVDIYVSRIPADADRVVLYADGQEIGSMAAGGVSTKSYTHTFRTFGRQILTAEAYVNGEVVKLSWEKPVIVTGIRVTADRDSAWTGETVNFTVEAYPETAEARFYAEDLLFGTVSLTQSKGTLAHAFTEAGDRKITVRSEGGLRSEVLTLTISCIGQLEQPVLEAEELQYAGDGLTCSWNTTDNTDGYVLRVRYANGADILQRRIEDDGTERMHCTIPAEELGGAGVYELYLMNYGYQYNQGESEVITVELTEDTTPVFKMDKQSVMTGEPVNFTFCAFGATQVELWADGEAIETIPLTNGHGTLARPFTQSGQREITIRALGENGWTELSEVQILTVTSLGTLDAVQVTAEPVQMLGNSMKASWAPVEHADGYTVYFRNEAHETIWKLDTQNCAVSVPADQIRTSGNYYIMVVAHGAGYDQSQGGVNVTVVDRLPGPVILTPGENEACTNTDVTLTWQAVAGARSYVVSLARKTEARDAYGQPVYEKVWAAPNETVDVGTALSYSLSGLVYGGEYRVAVGSVVPLDSGERIISWTERLFSVQMPALTVTLTADSQTANVGAQVTLTAIASHPMTQAVLMDETGAVVETVSVTSEEVNGTQVFTFVITGEAMGEKTYTVTVSGTGELAGVQSAQASLTVKWVDPDAAVIQRVMMEPATAIVGKPVTFTIIANANTTAVEVFVQKQTNTRLRSAGGSTSVETLTPTPSPDGNTMCFYTPQFEEAGNVTMMFVPYNAKSEKGEEFTQPVTVYPKGKLPDPVITNPTPNAEISNWGCSVMWDPVVLPQGETFGGYNVTVYAVGSSGNWEAIPGHKDKFVGTTCYYNIPAMDEGAYRVEVYTVPAGTDMPSAEFSGVSFVEFWMKAPDVAITNPVNYEVYTVGTPIDVEGTAVGGVTKVLVRLITSGNNPKIVPVKDAGGNAVDYLVVDTVNKKFSAVLEPVKALTPANYGVEVYGFLDGMTIDAAATPITDYKMITVKSGILLADKEETRHWEFENGTMQFQVKTGPQVDDVVLYDRTDGKTLSVTFTLDDKTTPGTHIFNADKSVALSGEGLHEIVALNADGGELATIDVYVVTPTEDTPKNCPDGQTVRVWLFPVETGSYLKDVTSADTLVQKGTCGEYLLLWVNDSSYGFVHKDKLESERVDYRIITPEAGEIVDLMDVSEFSVEWDSYPNAKEYRVILMVEFINTSGKLDSEIIIKPSVTATTQDTHSVTFTKLEILDKFYQRQSFKNTTWAATIRVEVF